MSKQQELPADYKPFKHGFPTRENCDLSNPYEAFLWCLVALPYQNGAQLAFPVNYLQFVSKRLWDCGARPVADPVIKYRKPSSADPNWITSPGTWVDVDADDGDPRRPVEAVVDSLHTVQSAELAKELLSRMTLEQKMMLLSQTDPELFGGSDDSA